MLKGQDPSLVMGWRGPQAGDLPSCNTPVHHQRAADSFASTSLGGGRPGRLWVAGWGWHTENGGGTQRMGMVVGGREKAAQ